MNSNSFKKLISKLLFGVSHHVASLTLPTKAERELLEKEMLVIVQETWGRVIKAGKLNLTQEAATAQTALTDLSDQLLIGRATVEDFKAACRRWEEIVTK